MRNFWNLKHIRILCIASLLSTVVNVAQAVDPWPGESWSVSSNLTSLSPADIEFPINHEWDSNLSSAYWNPSTRRLWLSDNNGVFSMLRENGSGGFINERNYNVSGVSTQRDMEGITQTLDTNHVYLMHEQMNVIREYTVSAGTANQSWNLTSLVGNTQNDGTEGIAFIPDSWLATSGFQDGNGNLYTQSVHGVNGLGGIMLVAVQHFTTNTTGYVYAVDLNTNGTWTTVGKYKTASWGDSCDLAFDVSIGRLYILHNSSTNNTSLTNILEITDLTSSPYGNDRKFTTLQEFEVPSTDNIEGFAITPALTSSNTIGDSWCFFTDDNAVDGALRWFKQLPSPIAVYTGNNQSAPVSTAVPVPPSVLVQDAFHNPLTNFSITFTVTSGDGSITGGSTTTDTNGIATVGSWTLGSTPGPNTLSASGIGLTNSPVTFTAAGADSTKSNTLAISGPAYGESCPAYGIHTNYNWTILTVAVTNSPAIVAGTQYVCTAAIVTGNSFTAVSATNITLMHTNNATVTWVWATNSYLLTVQTNGAGGGTVTGSTGWLTPGSTSILTAAASQHWQFDGWSGDTNGWEGADNVITVEMTRARSITANFGIDQHTLTVGSAQGGEWPGSVITNYNTFIEQWVTNSPVAAGAGTQYVCVAATVLSNEFFQISPTNVTLTLTNNATLTWLWQTQYQLTAITNGSGSVTGSTGWLTPGSTSILTAVASQHWQFDGWSGDTNGWEGADNVITVEMTRARSITANFGIDQHTLTASSAGNGSVTTPGEGIFTNNYGTTPAIVATPDANYHFVYWSGTAADAIKIDDPNAASTTVTVEGDYTVIANFAIDTHTLQIESLHGTPEPDKGTYTNDYGTLLTNTASLLDSRDSTQYVCTGWALTGNEPISGTTTSCVLTLTNNATLIWTWKTQYMFTATAGLNGTVLSTNEFYDESSNATATALAGEHYHFAGWTGDVMTTQTNDNPLTLTMNHAYSIVAVFAEDLATNATPEWWLAQYTNATLPTFNDVAMADIDGDGIPTWAEWQSDTDPTNKTSSLSITEIIHDGNQFRINWKGGRWARQYVQTRKDITSTDEEWISIYTNDTLPMSTTNSLITIEATNHTLFYRIKAGRVEP